MKPTPKPRIGTFYGAPIHNIVIGDTWLEGEEFTYPSGGLHRRCYALCPDNKLRVVKCGVADTFFSIPAYARIKGKRVKGFITSDEHGFKFNVYKGEQHNGRS